MVIDDDDDDDGDDDDDEGGGDDSPSLRTSKLAKPTDPLWHNPQTRSRNQK